MPERRLVTRSEAETVSLGRTLAAELRPGDVVLLEGVLGAGKTALARGLAAGLVVPEEEVRSPTAPTPTTTSPRRAPDKRSARPATSPPSKPSAIQTWDRRPTSTRSA
jgi:ABC-type glutathione transport system ATPase component